MNDLLRTIRKTDEARRAAKAARTQLERLGDPRHFVLMESLARVAADLEKELAALRRVRLETAGA